MIHRTLFAAAVDNPRYAMNGVLWELEGAIARLVATDGRRLAVISGAAVSQGGQDTRGQTHVVPKNAMNLLERILQDPEETVRVSLRPNEVLFKTERSTIYSRLVEGRYPDYRQVFPKKATVRISLTAAPFHAAIRQSAIMTDEDSKKVEFRFAKGKLTLSAKGSETGRAKVDMPLEYDGKEIKISFDPKFLMEMLRVVEPDAPLTLDLVDGNSPALFKHGENYSYVVMPLTQDRA
jgi:DNA polymerase-3 subunit beta